MPGIELTADEALSASSAPARPPRSGSDPLLESELRALIAVSTAVAAAHRCEEVLEIVAQQALMVLPAAAVSVSRASADGLTALLRAGASARGADPALAARRAGARPFVLALADPDLAAVERAAVQALGMGSMLAVPIRVDDRIWGWLDAFAAPGRPDLTAEHVQFAEALGAQLATAIGRAELFSRLESAAYEDPLTGLPNRRALDERLEDAVARGLATGAELALLFCDLDGLKDINDGRGHDAGDQALEQAARALEAAAEAFPGSFTSRLGGDEFCVLMEGYGAKSARALARDAVQRLAAIASGPLTLSCGVACLDDRHQRSADLFRAADAAQYAAKRVGGGKVLVAEPGIAAAPVPSPGRWSRRRFRDAGPQEREALVRYLLAELDDGLGRAGPCERLEQIAVGFADAFDAPRWAISRCCGDVGQAETLLGVERRDRYDAEAPDIRFTVEDGSYGLTDSPLTATALERGGGFTIAVDDAEADASERALLRAWGFTAVTAATVTAPDGITWLLELYSDRRTHALPSALPELRLLTSYATAVTSRANISNTSR